MRDYWRGYAYTSAQREKIMACIQRLNVREDEALAVAVLRDGHRTLPRPYVRQQLRSWFRQRWEYLISEYEKSIEETPPAEGD